LADELMLWKQEFKEDLAEIYAWQGRRGGERHEKPIGTLYA
jgi:hypothetical protein